MRLLLICMVIATCAVLVDAARAFPDGAPWGAANPGAEQSCATCHFDDDPVRDSGALVIDGLPKHVEPDATYELQIKFDDPATVVAGFQLLAHATGESAGTFVSDAVGVEFVGATIRSTQPIKGGETVSWPVTWRAPATLSSSIVFYVAATAANDDGSPFGDKIHYRTYAIPSN